MEQARLVGARGGSCVVRLKGGDPFLFGRGGEEALALSRAGVPFEVVPGVTSGIAASAYAGIPVTHRGIASTVSFVTGHEDPAKGESNIDWQSLACLARRGGTICLYMGMRNLGLLSERLQAHGLPGEFPVAIVQWGTTPRQRTLISELEKVEEAALETGIGAPAIILVGNVARLHEELSWLENRPLFGRRFVVTRARSQAGELTARLRELGADVIEFPAIEFCEPDDSVPLDRALSQVNTYDWIVFTSVNGVDAFFGHLPGDARLLSGSRIAAIGPATAKRLSCHGIHADAIPDEYRAEAVFKAMEQTSSLRGARVLIARAQEARQTLPSLLREAGAHVDVVAAYKTVAPLSGREADLIEQLEAGAIDGVTFTSSSTARNLVAMLGTKAEALEKTVLYSIGPITSATLRDLGFNETIEAREYTIGGLLKAIVEEER